MYIKAQTVLPAGTKITKCEPNSGKGKNIFSLLQTEERKLAAEVELKTKANIFVQLLKAGHSAVEAMKLIST